MIFPGALIFFAFVVKVDGMLWDHSYMLGDVDYRMQTMKLLLDVNSDETFILNRKLADGTDLKKRGYDTTVSRTYKPSNVAFSQCFKKPIYDDNIQTTGVYANDLTAEGSFWRELTFGLINKISGVEPISEVLDTYSGVLGLSRRTPKVTNFRHGFFSNGNTFCIATNCNKTARMSFCTGTIHTKEHGGRTGWEGYRGVYYTSTNVSAGNPQGWSIVSRGFEYGNIKSRRSFDVKLSTTSMYLTVPDSFFKGIVKKLNATEYNGHYLVDSSLLNTADPIVLIIEGKIVSIPAMDYLDPYGNGKFWLKIKGGASLKEWTAGEPFTDALGLCLDYDKDEVSLYKIKFGGLKADPTKKSFVHHHELSNGVTIKQTQTVL